MDIHKPKAAHSWREFLIEIGTIVCGIVIALALEQAVDWLHWQAEVGRAREHLRDEIRFDQRVYVHRVDVAECVLKRSAEIKGMVQALRSGARGPLVSEFVSPENGAIQSEAWDSLKAAQVLGHFPKAELEQYSRFYQARIDAEYFMDRESRAWRTLHLLEGDPNRLTSQDLSALWIAQGDAAEMSRGVAFISKDQVAVARALGIEVPRPEPKDRPECTPIFNAAKS
jgi:hypothetical protein